jgi:hypothetical protein
MKSMTVLAATLVLMAGCSGLQDKSPAKAELPSVVDAGEGSASIWGLVMNDESFPISGALIQIVKNSNRSMTPWAAQTNASGLFLAKGLAPGQYFVSATKDNFTGPKGRVVLASEGNQTRISFILTPVIFVEDHHTTLPYRVRFVRQACAAGIYTYCATSYTSTNISKNQEMLENKTGIIRTHIVEGTFEHEYSFCKAGVRTTLYAPDSKAAWSTAADNTTSPTRLVVVREGAYSNAMADKNGEVPYPTSGVWRAYTWPYPRGSVGTPVVDVSCMTETIVNLWWTTFFGAPGPLDFSALPP